MAFWLPRMVCESQNLDDLLGSRVILKTALIFSDSQGPNLTYASSIGNLGDLKLLKRDLRKSHLYLCGFFDYVYTMSHLRMNMNRAKYVCLKREVKKSVGILVT